MIELPFYYGREKFMDYIISVFLGYGLGCLNPAWFISRAKHIDIRKRGTGNPGTTNAFINLGKGWGLIVLVCDLCKAYAAVKVCQRLFPESALVGVVAGCAAVMGHIFPFYLKFHGGKELQVLADISWRWIGNCLFYYWPSDVCLHWL